MSKYSDFKSRIDTLKQQYPTYLNNFIQSYQDIQVSPNDTDASRRYNDNLGYMRMAADSIFSINNEIQMELKTSETGLATWNTKISDETKRTTELQTTYNDSVGNVGGAQTLINDYKSLYVLQYISNVSLF